MGLGEKIAARRQKTRKKIVVQEWGDEGQPLEIFAAVLTCYDVDRLQKRHKDFLTNMGIEAMVDLLILKAETKDGEKMFTLEDKPFLMREPIVLMSRVAAEVFGSVVSVEEAEKN